MNRTPTLDLKFTFNDGSGDVDYRRIFTSVGSYAQLFANGLHADLDWANGSFDINAPGGDWQWSGGVWVPSSPPITIVPNFFDGYGIVGWSIDAGPGQVPGKLSVALYKQGSALDAPDVFNEFDLNSGGGWDTGSLPISTTSDINEQYLEARIRFVPEHLQILL